MRSPIRIPQGISLRELDHSKAVGDVSAVALPRKLVSEGDFSVEASLIQYVGTILRKNPDAKVEPPEGADDAYFGSAYAIGLHLLGKGPSSAEDSQEYRSKRKAWLNQIGPYLDAIYWGRYEETSSRVTAIQVKDVNLISIPGMNREAILPLYSEKGKVRPPNELSESVGKILKTIIPKNYGRSLKDIFYENIGHLIHELFENVEDHATTNEFGIPIQRNLKMVLLKYRFSQAPHLEKLLREGGQSAYSFYMSKLYALNSLPTGAPLLEISVVDLGPGYFKRYVSAHDALGLRSIDSSLIPLVEEESIVRQCFDLHVTSKHRLGYGVGLARVSRIVSGFKGMVRIRTGRVALSFDYADARAETPFQNFYGSGAAGISREPLPFREGSVISIVLPLTGLAQS